MASKRRRVARIKGAQQNASAIQKIDNQYIAPEAASNRASIMRSNSILQEQGFILEEDRSIYTTKGLARRFLENLNCAEVPLGPGYSLVQTQRSETKIGNPSIANPNDKNQVNQQISTNRSFSQDCDPFYELDGQKPDRIADEEKRKQNKDRPDLIMTANFIAQVNAEGKQVRLKQFMHELAKHRSNY